MKTSSIDPRPQLLVIGGPTASGKTSLAIRIAEHLQTEILSADSRQFYREISIGTAKPLASELEQVRHHFVNTLSIDEEYTAADYERDALDLLKRLFETHHYAVLTGGSGLFIKAVCEGFHPAPSADKELRAELKQRLHEQGIETLAEELRLLDPDRAEQTDLHNPQRVIRAIEIAKGPRVETPKAPRFFDARLFYIDLPREELYSRINDRVDEMMQNGLLEEVRSMIPYRNHNALQTVGYKELFEYLDGTYDLETAVSLIKQHTRNYAKRQITWFRNQGGFLPLKPHNAFDDILKRISNSG